jgi:glycosyltransferase involved in cell wall biosynthesis
MPHRYPPNGYGGVETWAQELAGGLVRLGHRVAVLTRDDGETSPFPPFATVEGPERPVQVHRIRHLHRYGRTFRDSWCDLRFRGPIEAVLDAFEPDVVHVGHPDGWGVLPFRLAAARGLVTGATLHDYKWICARGQMVHPSGELCQEIREDRCVGCIADQLARTPVHAVAASGVGGCLLPLSVKSRRRPSTVWELQDSPSNTKVVSGNLRPRQRPRWPRHWRRRWEMRQRALLRELEGADVVTSPSRFVADRTRLSGLERPVVIIPNGVDGPPPVPRPTSGSGPLRVGFFGTSVPTKGLDLLVAAFASLPVGSATLDVHGPTTSDVRSPPPGVRVHGPYPPGAAPGLMAHVDLVAIPSIWDENQPMVAIEARAAARPLLVSDRGGLPELVRDGVDGWIVESGDLEAWGERLALLCSQRRLVTLAAGSTRAPSSTLEMARAFEQAWNGR